MGKVKKSDVTEKSQSKKIVKTDSIQKEKTGKKSKEVQKSEKMKIKTEISIKTEQGDSSKKVLKVKEKNVKIENKTKKIKKSGKGNKNGLEPAMKAKTLGKKKEKQQESSGPKELVSRETIKEALESFQTELKSKTQKKSIVDPDFKYCIQICCFKVPKCPARLARMDLPHSLVSDTDDICLFVKDLEKGKKADFDQTIQHYKEKLEAAGVTQISRFISVTQLKKEYGSNEMKMKLVNSFDVFLADAIISKRIFKPLGKNFILRKKSPIAVRLNHTKLKDIIERALKKVCYKQVNSGNSMAIDIGKHNMAENEISDNIYAAINNLKTCFPGGWQNIRSIHLKPAKNISVSLPLYIDLSKGDNVPVPNIIGPKEKALKKKQKKLNSLLPENIKISDKGNLALVKTGEKKNKPQNKDKSKKNKKENSDKTKVETEETSALKENIEKKKKKEDKKASLEKSKKKKNKDKIEVESKENDDENLAEEVKDIWEQIKQEGEKKVKKNKNKVKAEKEPIEEPTIEQPKKEKSKRKQITDTDSKINKKKKKSQN